MMTNLADSFEGLQSRYRLLHFVSEEIDLKRINKQPSKCSVNGSARAQNNSPDFKIQVLTIIKHWKKNLWDIDKQLVR